MITRIKLEDPHTSQQAMDAWLAERKKSIGGSEIGAIMGTNQFQSPYALWCERTGKTPAFEGNLATEIGTFLEPFVADRFTRETGIELEKTDDIWRNDLYPVIHATPDRICKNQRAGLEIKTTDYLNTEAFHGVRFPAKYYWQCVQYMAVCEMNVWYLAVLVANRELHIYQLVRDMSIPQDARAETCIYVDESEINNMYRTAEDFWNCIQRDMPPPMDGSAATAEALGQRYPTSSKRRCVLPGCEGLFGDYRMLRNQAEMISKQIEAIKNEVKAMMQDAEIGTVGCYKATWVSTEKKGFDVERCIRENPNMARYRTSTSIRRFTMD